MRSEALEGRISDFRDMAYGQDIRGLSVLLGTFADSGCDGPNHIRTGVHCGLPAIQTRHEALNIFGSRLRRGYRAVHLGRL